MKKESESTSICIEINAEGVYSNGVVSEVDNDVTILEVDRPVEDHFFFPFFF